MAMNVEINIILVNSGLSLLFRVIFAHLKRPFGLLLFPARVEEGRGRVGRVSRPPSSPVPKTTPNQNLT